MKYCYVCNDCLSEAAGGDVKSLQANEYSYLCSQLMWEVTHNSGDKVEIKCETCGSNNIKKLLMPPTSYVRGYGYLDKRGATNDRDLYIMTQGKDPYVASRRPGEKEEVVRKLRKQKEFNPRTKAVNISKKN